MKKRNPSREQSSLSLPQSLTEKYRPQRIEDFVGMERVKRVLSKFAAAPYPASFLFVGEPGLGKTTMALALAKAVGAEIHHIASQKCTVESVEEIVGRCWYVPIGGGFHLVLVDEADKMSYAAQLALLSKLDATEPPPMTIWIFTCNTTAGLEKRFLSRCRVLEFSRESINGDLAALLGRIWRRESEALPPDFEMLANDSGKNVRDALLKLEVELMAA